jgi:hypothetical protein
MLDITIIMGLVQTPLLMTPAVLYIHWKQPHFQYAM